MLVHLPTWSFDNGSYLRNRNQNSRRVFSKRDINPITYHRFTGCSQSTRMRSRRISKWGLASLVGTIRAWASPPPVIVRFSYRRCRAVAGDGCKDSDLSTRSIAATVIKMHRMTSRQVGVILI
ncbi:hypothetical protein AVEN_165820-1 [Araneus ventricosus]|uniref:Uncharacterized protein n=1 Tax=Araneus ventricosus TaxID=182803 RepID=A0A4Y2EMX4_ARAVE|nr:hypothetical protein AVEN_165820-1 [Araneus ventricosus]